MKTENLSNGAAVVRLLSKAIHDNHRGIERCEGADRRKFSYPDYLSERRHTGERRESQGKCPV